MSLFVFSNGSGFCDNASGARDTIFLLPAKAGFSGLPSPPAEGDEETSREKVVLVIDDELDVAELISEMVCELGYRAEGIATGNARARIIDDSAIFACLIVSLPLPAGEGPQFLAWLEQDYPLLALLTGFIVDQAPDPFSKRMVANRRRAVLRRPFGPEQLSRFITRIVDPSLPDGPARV